MIKIKDFVLKFFPKNKSKKEVTEIEEYSADNENPEDYRCTIVSFKYNYGSGFPSYYTNQIKRENGEVLYTYHRKNMSFLGSIDEESDDIEKGINASYLEKLVDIVIDNDIYKWNDFDGKGAGGRDCYSFNLEIKYENGNVIKAYGYGCYPKKYDEGHNALKSFFDDIKKNN